MRTSRLLIATSMLWIVSGCTDAAPDDPVPAKGGVAEVDLGTIASDTPFTIQIPENTTGFQLVAQVDGSAGTEEIGISSLISPSGKVIVEDFYSPGNHVPFATQFGIVAVSIPQTSMTAKDPIEAGEWTVVPSVTGNLPAHAKVFVRTTEDGQFHGGALDLRLYIPDGLLVGNLPAYPITAATAATDPEITARVDGFYSTLKDLYDLDRGDVEFAALPGAFANIKDEASRNEAMMKTSSGAAPAMQFIFVNTLTTEGGGTSWGLTTWNPGTAMVTGHPMSGVFVNISLSHSGTADGMTMVHELGHFHGLYHTTEGVRTYHDPIDDTPECQTTDSVCPDANNIMFATFYGATHGVGLTVSDQQRRVVWGSPLYHSAD